MVFLVIDGSCCFEVCVDLCFDLFLPFRVCGLGSRAFFPLPKSWKQLSEKEDCVVAVVCSVRDLH